MIHNLCDLSLLYISLFLRIFIVFNKFYLLLHDSVSSSNFSFGYKRDPFRTIKCSREMELMTKLYTEWNIKDLVLRYLKTSSRDLNDKTIELYLSLYQKMQAH